MIRKLLIVFASGLALSITLLGSAWVVGGAELMDRIEKEGGVIISIDDDGDVARSTRTFAYDGSQVLEIATPAELRFTRGDKREMRVSGRAATVDALRFESGRLVLGKGSEARKGGLRIEISAPAIAGLTLSSASDVDLDGLDQQSLRIDSRGAIDLRATGKLKSLTVSSAGAGDLDFSEVETADATVETAGVGDIDIAAGGRVDVRISGAGKVTLHRKPAMLTNQISGVGSVEHNY